MLNTELDYAGFWRRMGAALLDGAIFTVLFSLLLGPIYLNAEFWSAEGLLSNALWMGLTAWLWVKFLGTPGKLLLGCQVVDAQTFEPLRPRQAVLRFFAYIVSLLPLGLGFLWVIRDKRKQSFHDKIANTVVLHEAGLEADDESQKTLSMLMAEVR
ncbi:MAG: RDD family protein [Gammaproteobacteria bacterium]|nr:RDD family protein [Gammaproteobacteria bacterium]MCF6364516.1 RDD family protein [Gammaproteobacteria bacterium]